MCELLGIDKTLTTPFHPASDGMVERFNRTMESMLRMQVSADQSDWDEKLPCLLMAYRATKHEHPMYPRFTYAGQGGRTPSGPNFWSSHP